MVAVTYGVARAAAGALKKNAKGKSILARFYDAMVESRMKQAERELRAHGYDYKIKR